MATTRDWRRYQRPTLTQLRALRHAQATGRPVLKQSGFTSPTINALMLSGYLSDAGLLADKGRDYLARLGYGMREAA